MVEPSILLADDDEDLCRYCSSALKPLGVRIVAHPSVKNALDALEKKSFDLVLADLEFPDGSGLELLETARKSDPQAVVVLITGKGTIQSALEAMKRGAFDYLLKPLSPQQLRANVRKALAHRALLVENRDLKTRLAQLNRQPGIVGESAAIQSVLRMIEKVAPHDTTVLIAGESGTGKELVARTLHSFSPRGQGPFVAINCSALSETLLESELFGHEKGAFTGAIASRRGVFAQADRGTLLLDEIGTMPPSLQAKLLRVLEDKQVRPLGADRAFPVNVRVLSATNANLEQQIAKGQFREDLFFRLNVVSIPVPPLRERKEDIALLAAHFIQEYFPQGPLRRIDPQALALLERYSWPGNVRQLSNIIERAGVLAEGETLTPELLPAEIRLSAEAPASASLLPHATLAEVEKEHILAVLNATGWHRSKAAQCLGISRRTLYNKMAEYAIEPPKA